MTADTADRLYTKITGQYQALQDSTEYSQLRTEHLSSLAESLASYARYLRYIENSRVGTNKLPREIFLEICKHAIAPSGSWSLRGLYGNSPCMKAFNREVQARLVNFRIAVDGESGYAYPFYYLKCLSHCLPLDSPRLESLVMFLPSMGVAGNSPIAQLFDGTTGSLLRALALSPGSLMTSISKPLPLLTHLYLSFQSCRSSFRPLQAVLRLLSSSPRIQFLVIRNVKAESGPPADGSEVLPNRLPMRHLRNATFLKCAWSFAVHVLDSLALPANSHVHITDAAVLEKDLPAVQVPKLPFFDGPATRMRMLFHSRLFSVVVDGPLDESDAGRPAGRLHIERLQCTNGGRVEPTSVGGLLLPSLRALHIRVPHWTSEEPAQPEPDAIARRLPELLQRLPQLEAVVLDLDPSPHSDCEQRTDVPKTQAPPRTPFQTVLRPFFDALAAPVVLPALRSLGVRFGNAAAAAGVVGDAATEWPVLLHSWAEARAACGRPLADVYAECHGVDAESGEKRLWRCSCTPVQTRSYPNGEHRRSVEWVRVEEGDRKMDWYAEDEEGFLTRDRDELLQYWEVPKDVTDSWHI
ncbi:uncharacterized protein BXZ73DRAFT_109536 [Epithele typhae]|uniref:uncharacterized protein n=1 Tax=Epithele typhae TaxID=378194 RepID=UPI002007FD62|nr:uncharacterized protein BXZ73DRAFT_109536 [Epithele typhae]KAH9910122.1 hypothetical protein BXZ73DRAFT_109536 [Epithele typhae]